MNEFTSNKKDTRMMSIVPLSNDIFLVFSQLKFTRSKSAIETLEKCMKCSKLIIKTLEPRH